MYPTMMPRSPIVPASLRLLDAAGEALVRLLAGQVVEIAIVGQQVRMNGVQYLVAGVMPAWFDLTSDSEEVWTPIAFT